MKTYVITFTIKSEMEPDSQKIADVLQEAGFQDADVWYIEEDIELKQ